MTNAIKAVILAAGMGSRLRPLTDHVPKAMIDLGNGHLLERLARQCASVGVSEVLVVTGYQAEQVDRWASSVALSVPVKTIFNPDYATMNNGQSLLVVREHLHGQGMIKFDGDLVLHSETLRDLMGSPASSALVLDSTRTLTEEDMKARLTAEGSVGAIGKWIPLSDAAGISIGVERFSARDAGRVFEALQIMVHEQKRHDAWYEDAYHDLLDTGFEMAAVDTQGRPWMEIDTPEDLAQARELAASGVLG